MSSNEFDTFLKHRDEVASAYVRGDAAPLSQIVARELPATFFSPMGGHLTDAKAVAERYSKDAGIFEPEGESRLEILQSGASGDIGYWAGFQRATVKLRGQAEPQVMNLRVTEIFRRENGEWKLVHRHADMLADAPAGR